MYCEYITYEHFYQIIRVMRCLQANVNNRNEQKPKVFT